MINKTVLKTPRIVSEANVRYDQLICYILKYFDLYFAPASHSCNLLQLFHIWHRDLPAATPVPENMQGTHPVTCKNKQRLETGDSSRRLRYKTANKEAGSQLICLAMATQSSQ